MILPCLITNIVAFLYGQCVYFQEIREFLVSEVKVVHALCVASGVEHKYDSRPGGVTHALLRLSQCFYYCPRSVVSDTCNSVRVLQNISAASVHYLLERCAETNTMFS